MSWGFILLDFKKEINQKKEKKPNTKWNQICPTAYYPITLFLFFIVFRAENTAVAAN